MVARSRRPRGAVVVLAAFLLLPFQAWPQGSGAKPAEPSKTQELIDRLAKLVDEAERTRSADPQFIKSLRELVRDYDRPWRIAVLHDDFRDGDFTSGVAWQVAQGEFWVDWLGLRSRVAAEQATPPASKPSAKQDPAMIVLGTVLDRMVKREGAGQPAAQAPAAPSGRAELFVPAAVSNA
ncbi:MAG: hypothetical protein ACREGL_03180, partial [Alphaproteobacteria bacterium]